MKHYLLYGTSIAIPVVSSLAMLGMVPTSHHQDIFLEVMKLFWFSGLVFVTTNVAGLLYGSPHKTDADNLDNYAWGPGRLIVSYVSRGDNLEALTRAISRTRQVLADMNVPAEIEVVTDLPVDIPGTLGYLVPEAYRTLRGAQYKARALQYLLEQRQLRLPVARGNWVIHLDEESVLTPQAVAGISKFIARPTNGRTIGQGEIQYNAHGYGDNFLITCIDSIRTGDDLGRFRLQYRLFGKPLFGMHGSFILLPQQIEQEIGFDLTSRGSITEDAYFALTAMDRGYQFGWVDGFIQEQSPFSLVALLKQRRRWIAGLRTLVTDPEISFKSRVLLLLNMTLWRIAWVGPVVTAWNVLAGGSLVPHWAAVSAALLSGVVGSVYMVGAWRNLMHTDMTRRRKLTVWLGSYLFAPLSCLVEGVAVLYALTRPIRTFEVVAK